MNSLSYIALQLDGGMSSYFQTSLFPKRKMVKRKLVAGVGLIRYKRFVMVCSVVYPGCDGCKIKTYVPRGANARRNDTVPVFLPARIFARFRRSSLASWVIRSFFKNRGGLKGVDLRQ